MAAADLTPTSNVPKGFQEVFANIYVSREKRIESEDDVYECNCNPQHDEFCGIGCLNRMYSAECNADYCLVGSKCENRRFQNRQWADIEIRNAGKKGWGLFAKQDIKKNAFVIEYVGEIIDSVEVKNRLRWKYFGSKKFFILSIGSGYLIDATQKGSKARFINHSCAPNCATQKWTVLGERCIGFFALRHIKINEELTFDYQFQRYGEELQPCYCGESNCRKYLGSTPNKTKLTHINITHNSKINKKPIIIYRKMDKKVQLHRHSIYLKHLLNYPSSFIHTKQISKGIVCNKSQLQSQSQSAIRYNDHDMDHHNLSNIQQNYQFDNILYLYCKELNVDQIRAIALKLNSLNIFQFTKNSNNILLHQLYGGDIDCINIKNPIINNIPSNSKSKHKNERIPKRIIRHRICVKQNKIKNVPKKAENENEDKKNNKMDYDADKISVLISPLSDLTPTATAHYSESPTNTIANIRKRQRSDADADTETDKKCKRQKTNNAFASASNTESDTESNISNDIDSDDMKHRSKHKHHRGRKHKPKHKHKPKPKHKEKRHRDRDRDRDRERHKDRDGHRYRDRERKREQHYNHRNHCHNNNNINNNNINNNINNNNNNNNNYSNDEAIDNCNWYTQQYSNKYNNNSYQRHYHCRHPNNYINNNMLDKYSWCHRRNCRQQQPPWKIRSRIHPQRQSHFDSNMNNFYQ